MFRLYWNFNVLWHNLTHGVRSQQRLESTSSCTVFSPRDIVTCTEHQKRRHRSPYSDRLGRLHNNRMWSPSCSSSLCSFFWGERRAFKRSLRQNYHSSPHFFFFWKKEQVRQIQLWWRSQIESIGSWTSASLTLSIELNRSGQTSWVKKSSVHWDEGKYIIMCKEHSSGITSKRDINSWSMQVGITSIVPKKKSNMQQKGWNASWTQRRKEARWDAAKKLHQSETLKIVDFFFDLQARATSEIAVADLSDSENR